MFSISIIGIQSAVAMSANGVPDGVNLVTQGGLQWIQVGSGIHTYDQAYPVCGLLIQGPLGWRLPEITELAGLTRVQVDKTEKGVAAASGGLYGSGALNGHGWASVKTWTANASAWHAAASYSSHLFVDLSNGEAGSRNDSKGLEGPVTCVRRISEQSNATSSAQVVSSAQRKADQVSHGNYPDQNVLIGALTEFYNKRGEWAGTFRVDHVEKLRLQNINDVRLIAHVRYFYIPVAGNSQGRTDSGFDQRIFVFNKIGSDWQVAEMGGYMSAQF